MRTLPSGEAEVRTWAARADLWACTLEGAPVPGLTGA